MATGLACRGIGTWTTVPFSSFDKTFIPAMNSSFDVHLKRNVADCLKALALTAGPGKCRMPSRMSPAVGWGICSFLSSVIVVMNYKKNIMYRVSKMARGLRVNMAVL